MVDMVLDSMASISSGDATAIRFSPLFLSAERAKERVLAGDAVSVRQLRSKMWAADRATQGDHRCDSNRARGRARGRGRGGGGDYQSRLLLGTALVAPGFVRELVIRAAAEEERRREAEAAGRGSGRGDNDDGSNNNSSSSSSTSSRNNNNNNNNGGVDIPELRLLSDQTVVLFLALYQSLAWLVDRWPGLDKHNGNSSSSGGGGSSGGGKGKNDGDEDRGGSLSTVAAGALLLARSALRCRLHVALSSTPGEEKEKRDTRQALAQRQLAPIHRVLIPPSPSWSERGRGKRESNSSVAELQLHLGVNLWKDLKDLEAELLQRHL